MNERPNSNARRSLDRIARSFDEVAPEELAEAEEELRALGFEPSAVGDKLERLALESARARILRDHSSAFRARIPAQAEIDLSDKLN